MRPIGGTAGRQEQPANQCDDSRNRDEGKDRDRDKAKNGDPKKKEKARAKAKRGKSLMQEAILRGD